MTATVTADLPGSLAASYEACRALHRRHGTTYYWAARLLPRDKRPHVHALYGFCRYADEIVDDLGPATPQARAAALAALRGRVARDLAIGWSDHEVLAALVHTVRTLGIDPEAIDRFLRSMAMDLHVTEYETWDDLCVYMDGSAAVIGEMMLPVLEPLDEAAFRPARDLGIAFQLTNFLRDVGEDLARGRVYLPVEDLVRFGADPVRRQVNPAWVELMRFEIDRARHLYESADRGIELLPPRSAACVRTARVLYSRILDRIEANGYDVFSTRARVSTPAKAGTAVRCLAGTIGTRKP
jgi:15-cis-phytoene synthase